jgi:putative thioredoxin
MSAESHFLGPDGHAAAPEPTGDLVKETTTQAFRADVLDASREAPVLVDFWAPWCGPCRQLTPVLEKVVKAAKGRVKLVKMNIDDHPQIAGQLGIQSIPAVIAFKDGQPLDGFMGALPESQVQAFIDRIAGPAAGDDDVEAALAAGNDALGAHDFAGAAALFSGVLQAAPANMNALGGLIRCFVALGELAQARGLLAGLTPEQDKDPAIASARTALELATQAEKLGSAADLRRRIEANPNDHQARFDLALVLNGEGDRAGAADALLEIVRRSRTWNDEAARKQLLQFFEAWGPKDPAVLDGRQRLSSLLFA